LPARSVGVANIIFLGGFQVSLADWFRILLLSLLWGCSFFFVEITLESFGILTLVMLRVGIAAAFLMLYCMARGIPLALSPRVLGGLAIVALLQNVLPFSLIAAGQIQITSGLTAILIAATPLFTVLLGHVWPGGEPITPAKLGGVLIGMVGVAVLMGSDAIAGISGSLLGQLSVLAAAFIYAVSGLYARRFRDLRPSVISTWMLLLAALILAPFAFVFETPLSPLPDLSGVAAMVGLALLSTAFAFLLYFRVLASAGATNALLVTFVQPPVAILLGVLFLHEAFLPHHLMGMALIFIGLTLVDGRVVRLVTRRA